MANANNFSTKDWELVKNGPAWVFAAISAADSGQGASNLRNIRELKEYQKAVSSYKTDSELVKVILAVCRGGDGYRILVAVAIDIPGQGDVNPLKTEFIGILDTVSINIIPDGVTDGAGLLVTKINSIVGFTCCQG